MQERGDAFLNSIVRFWENRTKEATEAQKQDALNPQKTLSTEQLQQVKQLYATVDKNKCGLVNLSALLICFGGDMASILTNVKATMDGKVSSTTWGRGAPMSRGVCARGSAKHLVAFTVSS